MRKFFLCLLMSLIGMFCGLQAQTIVLSESFETGDFSKWAWTQENVVGNTAWAVESIDEHPAYPSNFVDGTHRAYLRNNTGETQGYVTRLITPVMRLDTVYQPILRFWYANPKWTADRDTLRVLYRTEPKSNWKELAVYSDAHANWQKVELELPNYSEAYQIAFEGKDNLGHGIVLDSIVVRSTPECTVPHDLVVVHQGAGKVNLSWIANWDANFFEVIVSKNQIDPDTVQKIPVEELAFYDDSIPGLQQNVNIDLVSGEYYYAYVRTICEEERSAWNNDKGFRFRVKATKNVPYHYPIDFSYEENIIRRDLEWTWGNNTGNFNPFIDVNLKPEGRAPYSKDSTTCIVFTGANNMTTAIPAGKYAYVASPALADTLNADFALNQCQVRFWTTVYQYTGGYAHSLIVGVMTDPENFATFEPIDTVSVWGTSTFVENIVDLSSYQGNAGYIAFLSAFDEQNIIYLDDIYVEYKNDAQKPTNISVNPRDTYADITWKSSASNFNILITNAEVNPAEPIAGAIVAQVNNISGNSYKCEVLDADHSWNRPYFVYVQAVGADTVSEWSYRYPFVTIASQGTLPYNFDFERTEGKYYTIAVGDNTYAFPDSIGIFSNDPEYPHLVSSNAHGGTSCLNLTKDPGNDSWITLPPVDSLKGTQVKFYLSGNTTPAQTSAIVGVMTNPMDINTFIPVSECKIASTGYTLCYANFQNYEGPNGIIAIKWGEVNGKQTINYIDDLTVEEIAKCLPPVNIQTVATSDSVTVTWDKSDANTWEFILATAALTDKQREQTLDSISHMGGVIFADTLTWDQPLNDPTFGFDSLVYNSSYYIYVRTSCEDEKTWWVANSFKTPCPDNFPIPFSENFEGVPTGDYSAGFKCWQVADYGTATGYPKILKPSSGAQDGNMLELWSTAATHRNVAMLPGIDADMKKVVLSFDARSYGTTTKSVLYVGSMGDIADWTSFVAIDTIYMDGGNEFTKVRLDLANYTLAYNNIVFSSGLGETLEMNSDIYIDNVVVKPNTCIEAWKLEATDIQTNSIDIKWEGKSINDEWKVKVMQDTVVVIADTTITGKAFRAEGLEPVKEYTFFVQPTCDTVWTSASYYTACVKLDPTKPNKETFDEIVTGTSYNAAYQIPCWTVGNANPSASTSYIPFVYKSATYASSGTNTYRAYGYSTTNSPAYIVSPEIDCQSMSELAVTFNIYASTSYWWICGVMSDPTDLSTFVALDSVKGTGKSVQYTYDLSEHADEIPATAKYFAWRGRYGVTDYLYLDDVSIIKITCPLPKPSYSGATAEKVTISSGLRTDNDWILLAVDTAAFSADKLALLNVDSLVHNDSLWQAHVVFYDTISARSKVVTGLKEQTDYYVAVATVCEDGISAWQMISFKTPCKAITPEAMGTITFAKEDGYVTGSGATRYLPCWTTGNKSGNASPTSSYVPYVTAGSATSVYSRNGLNYLYIYSYVSSSTSYDGAYAIMPELDVEDISKYQVNFWARTTTSTTAAYHDNLIVGVVTDPTDLNTFVAVDTLTLSHTAYEPFSVSLEDYQGDYMGNKGRYIMLMTETGVSGASAYGYAYVSEISVGKIPTCRNVTAFTVDSVSEDAGMISWKQYSDNYRVMVAGEAVADSLKPKYEWIIDSVVTKTDSVLITGLKPSTQYFVYAQALCESGDSSDISMVSAIFTTACPESGFAVPYKQDFERYATNAKYVDCWQFEDYATATKTYPQVLNPTSGAVSGKQLELWSTGTSHRSVAIMPKVQGNLTDYMLSFDARSYSVSGKSVLYIGTMDDVLDSAAGFAPFDTLYMEQGNEFYHKELVLANYASKLIHSRIAFTSGLAETLELASDMYLDNVRIGMPPSCFAPALEAGNTSMNTATINITPAKESNTNWQLAVIADSIYTKLADVDAYLDTLTNLVNADSVNFVISGLEPGTKYWVYARTICGGEDGNSEWSTQGVSTRTKFYYKDSYFFDFEKESGWERSPLSTSDSYIMHPAVDAGCVPLGTMPTSYSYMPHALITTSSGYNYGYGPSDWSMGKTGIRWNATSTYYGQYVIMPALTEAKDRSFEFKFRNGYSYISSNKYIITSSNNVSIEVGTVDKFKGMETYKKLATISMAAYASSTECTEANDWLWRSYTLDLDSATIADKQLVFFQAEKPTASNYPYIDNVTMGAPKGFGLVSFDKIQAEATKAIVSWENLGGPWNLYILKENGDTLKRYENLTATSQEVTGLTPKTKYTAALVAANAPEGTRYYVQDSRNFNTPCMPMEADANGEFFWNFDDPYDWEQNDVLGGVAADSTYRKPSCFTVGSTYVGTQSNGYQWLLQWKGYDYYSTLGSYTTTSTYAHHEIGYGDSRGSLRVYTTSTYNTETVKNYIVLPELNCDLDTMMIEFYGRPFANRDETYTTVADRGKVISTSYLGSHSLVIGTLTDPKDFSTLEVIDTLVYAVPAGLSTSTKVSTDPTGNRYWQKMQLPLAGTNGKYIVMFQPVCGANALFLVDNLKVAPVGDNLFAPSGAQTGEVTKNSATFNWIAKHPDIQTVVVVTDQSGKNEIVRDTVAGSKMTFTVDTLKASTGYVWYVYQTNGTVNTATAGNKLFYTECAEINPNYTNGFELADGWKILPAQTSDTYKQTLCWTYENAGTSALSTYEYNMLDATSLYSHSGEYALKLYATGTTYQTYAAMPAVEDIAAYDTLQLDFWMRPTYITKSTGKAYASYLGATYAKAIIVGTMTDPMDASTFVPIDTLNYTLNPGTNIASEANEFFYEKKKVILAGATGKYVTFMTTLYAKGDSKKYTYNYMYIDDISFSAVQHCEAPADLKAAEISANSATLSWEAPEGAEKYILQVSTDYTYSVDTAFVFNDTVFANSYVVTGMEAQTEYIWHVRTICGDELGESEFSQNATFQTARKPFFLENFTATDLDADWKFATNPAILVIDSTDVELSGSNSTSYGWRRTNTGMGGNYHYAAIFYSSSSATTYDYDYYWMISPSITLCDTVDALLTFDMALTGCSGTSTIANIPATEGSMADDYTFIIVISEDGGKTWKKENIVGVWNNTLAAGHQLRDIPFNPANYRIDLAKYAGKTIRVAFYREADTYKGSSPYSCAIHLDNVRINYYGLKEENAQACQYQDIDQLGFFIDGDKAAAGEKTYKRIEKADNDDAKTEGAMDSIFVLNVEYLEAVTTVFEDTICEGESYSSHDFGGKTTTGLYKRKLQGVNTCDSLVYLYLYVIPRQTTEFVADICQGEVYHFPDPQAFAGQTLDRPGIYYDTLSSLVTGCDSILKLTLFVHDPVTSEFSAKACETTGYYWEAVGKTYSESGDYTEKLATTFGCDSTVTLHLTIAKLYQDSKTAEIKKGESYTFYGETFTESGTYQVVVPGQGGECDSTHVLVLNVQTGLDNVSSGNLTLTPNVIRSGESVTATGNFKGNVHVEVYDIVGRMILNEDKHVNGNRITISAFDNSGVYTVRISDKFNTQFVGRVIVQ